MVMRNNPTFLREQAATWHKISVRARERGKLFRCTLSFSQRSPLDISPFLRIHTDLLPCLSCLCTAAGRLGVVPLALASCGSPREGTSTPSARDRVVFSAFVLSTFYPFHFLPGDRLGGVKLPVLTVLWSCLLCLCYPTRTFSVTLAQEILYPDKTCRSPTPPFLFLLCKNFSDLQPRPRD